MTGNEKLVSDLKVLLADAESGMFDDFKTELAFPKVELVKRLESISINVKHGLYD